MMGFMPGDPLYQLSPHPIKNIEDQTSLTYLFAQLLSWLKNCISGNLGWSTLFEKPVSTLLSHAAKNSLLLILLGMCFTLTLSYCLAIGSFFFKNKTFSKLVDFIATLSISLPAFWICLLVLTFLFKTKQIDLLSTENFSYKLWISAFVFMLTQLGIYTQHFKSQLNDTLSEDFIRTALAKGQSRLRILLRHATPFSLLPFLGILSVTIGQSFNGQLIIEMLFDYQGMGRIVFESIMANDIPLAFASVFLAITLSLLATSLLKGVEYYLTPKNRGTK